MNYTNKIIKMSLENQDKITITFSNRLVTAFVINECENKKLGKHTRKIRLFVIETPKVAYETLKRFIETPSEFFNFRGV